MSYWVYVTLSWNNWKRNDFRYSGAYFIYKFSVSHKCVLIGYSRHKKKTTFIGGMELVSLCCNREFTPASSYWLGWYKYAIATQWYQFHTTDAWWFSLKIISVADGWGISGKIALRWMLLDLTDYKSTLVQVMAWYRQATSLYLGQYWPRSLSPYGVTRPQWVLMYGIFDTCGQICWTKIMARNVTSTTVSNNS